MALDRAGLKLYVPLPGGGELHLVTSIFFDVGVYVLVVGLVLDLLRSLGSAIDRQILSEERDRAGEPEPAGVQAGTTAEEPRP